MSMIDDDNVSNTSGNEHFQNIVHARLSRRGFLAGGFAAAAAASLGGVETFTGSAGGGTGDGRS